MTRRGGGGREGGREGKKTCKALAPSAVKEISRWRLLAQGCGVEEVGVVLGRESRSNCLTFVASLQPLVPCPEPSDAETI